MLSYEFQQVSQELGERCFRSLAPIGTINSEGLSYYTVRQALALFIDVTYSTLTFEQKSDICYNDLKRLFLTRKLNVMAFLEAMKEVLDEREYFYIKQLYGLGTLPVLIFDELDLVENDTIEKAYRKVLAGIKKLYQARDMFQIISSIEGRNYTPEEMSAILITDISRFSNRAINALKMGSIETLGDLANTSIFEINKIRNIGKLTLKEIIGVAKEFGIIIPEFR